MFKVYHVRYSFDCTNYNLENILYFKPNIYLSYIYIFKIRSSIYIYIYIYIYMMIMRGIYLDTQIILYS